ncbi:MAG: D-alanine--D-alanine ligase [Geobacteraceae bacterium]|nr:D-alanine--D-alanine ligase [Geobacteraceae bacterium]
MTREELKAKKIGVLYGGLSAERDVSLKSGTAVCESLLSLGYDAQAIDVDRTLARKLADAGVEVAFVALHGRYGEDGAVQGLLEMMGIPYTGSGVLASALAMNKIFAKAAFQSAGLLVAPYRVLRKGERFDVATLAFSFPVVVKPSQEGSSVGVSIVKSPEGIPAAIELAFRYDSEILVEQFIAAREIQVGILGDQALGAIEIVPHNEFYDFEAKYTPGMAEHIFPAPLPDALYRKALQVGVLAHRAVGCCDYSRVDLLVTPTEECYILEVNTLPGMTALSLFPEIAGGVGISFGDLLERILISASLKISA